MKLSKNIKYHRQVTHGGPFSIKNPPKNMIDFSSNISPLQTPTIVKKFLKKHVDDISKYPDSNSNDLRKNLEKFTKISSEQIVVGNGATEIIYNFCNVFLNKNTPVLIPIPTFEEYEAAAKLSDCKILFFKTMNLENDYQDFINKIPMKGCLFVCNPNNPTGKLISKNILLKILQEAKKKSTLVFVDETFIELVPDRNETVKNYIKNFQNLFILRSLTKSFGLAGIRVGYGMGNKKIISILNEIKIPWNVSTLAQHAATAALCSKNYLKKSKKLIKQESKFLKNSISKIDGYECHDTCTNFILIKTKSNSKLIQKKLLRKKILIRDCSTFRALNNNYIRIAVKTRNENKKLIKALETI